MRHPVAAAQVGDERHAAQRRAVRARGVAVRAQFAGGCNGAKTRFSPALTRSASRDSGPARMEVKADVYMTITDLDLLSALELMEAVQLFASEESVFKHGSRLTTSTRAVAK
ncbi:hypothetical protein PF005_g32912 [Phytophthora fragariae]|uniref:Uncharacterized protein n=2 Tax=Phytophthora fragariae TaxID=53985 RepID=A0A6A3PPA7_9STRA|nr:hypothetical protein PF007_g32341 [Phytophthora fragariae]KAE9157225.1 hypothetical protein PF005_g32912 [Phytophthora fragariae]